MLADDSKYDFIVFQSCVAERKKAQAELNAASRALDSAWIHERAAGLLSQHQPAADLGINREKLRRLLRFVLHGREIREVE